MRLHLKISHWVEDLVRLIPLPLSLAYHTTGNTGGFESGTNTGSTGLFGQTNTAQQPPATTGLFGQNQPSGGAFGGGAFGA